MQMNGNPAQTPPIPNAGVTQPPPMSNEIPTDQINGAQGFGPIGQ